MSKAIWVDPHYSACDVSCRVIYVLLVLRVVRGACVVRHLSEAVFVKIVVEMKEEIVFACELNSQSEGVLFLAHYQDLHFNRLQCSHLHTSKHI